MLISYFCDFGLTLCNQVNKLRILINSGRFRQMAGRFAQAIPLKNS